MKSQNPLTIYILIFFHLPKKQEDLKKPYLFLVIISEEKKLKGKSNTIIRGGKRPGSLIKNNPDIDFREMLLLLLLVCVCTQYASTKFNDHTASTDTINNIEDETNLEYYRETGSEGDTIKYIRRENN